MQGRPTDELSLGIQVGPDAQSASATYVQQVRNRKDADGIRLLPHWRRENAEVRRARILPVHPCACFMRA